MKYKIFKRNIVCDNDVLNQLRQTQTEIDKIKKEIEMPCFWNYYKDEKTFSDNREDVLQYILMVIKGTADPLYLPYCKKYNNKEYDFTIQFWDMFCEYFKELAKYCKNKENKIAKLDELKEKEQRLKEFLNIK